VDRCCRPSFRLVYAWLPPFIALLFLIVRNRSSIRQRWWLYAIHLPGFQEPFSKPLRVVRCCTLCFWQD
jgi:hypothetical protein